MAAVGKATAQRPEGSRSTPVLREQHPTEPVSTYQHPSGFAFSYPQEWKLEAANHLSVRLSAPNAAANESYVFSVEEAQGTVLEEARRIQKENDERIAAAFPGSLSTGKPGVFRTQGSSAWRSTWTAKDAQGAEIQVWLYSTVQGKHVIRMLAVGPMERLRMQERVLFRIFSSLRPAEAVTKTPPTDTPDSLPPARPMSQVAAPAADDSSPLAREWRDRISGKKLTRLGSYSSGAAGGYSYRSELLLKPDGRYTFSQNSSVSVNVGPGGAAGGRGSHEGTWRVVTQGGNAALELKPVNGTPQLLPLRYEQRKTFLDGQRAFVTNP